MFTSFMKQQHLLEESFLAETPEKVVNKVNIRDSLSLMILGTTESALLLLVLLTGTCVSEVIFNNQLGMFPGQTCPLRVDHAGRLNWRETKQRRSKTSVSLLFVSYQSVFSVRSR
jgi:hypothetical protein